MPKITVIVPVYKVEQYIHRCVESILQQSFCDFDLVLVDDGSPDSCGVICDEYAGRDSRIHVIHQKNGGLSAARNTGIEWAFANSDSEWLSFIDSDDWVHKDYLSILLSAAKKNSVHFAACGSYPTAEFCEDKDVIHAEIQRMNAEDAFCDHHAKCMPAWGKIIKKDLFSDMCFPVGKLNEDAYITHLLLFSGEKVVVCAEKLYYYYSNPTSITRAKWSDRKLDGIEAHEQRLQFFKENHYQKAYRRELEIYIEELTVRIIHLLETRQSPDGHMDALRTMQSKLRFALQKARKEKAITTDRELMWSYLFAMRTDCLWKAAMVARAVYHKIKA